MNNKNRKAGEALFSEAASAFLDNIEDIAEIISPEEAVEYEEIRTRALNIFDTTYGYSNDEQLLTAAEESESYGKKE